MKQILRILGWGTAVALPLSLAFTAPANANPYAYASNVDSGFAIIATTGSFSPVAGSSVFTSTNTTTSSGLPAPFVGASGGTISGAGGADEVQATNGFGPFPGQNVFTQALLSGNGLRSDSVDTGFLGNGGNVAEGRLVSAPGGATGSSSGAIRSSTTAITVGAGTKLTISLTDMVGMEVMSAALPGESASSTITSSVSITNSAGVTVFSFAPTGGPGDVMGGTAISDPFSLNRTLGSNFGVPGIASFFNTGLFSATTDSLAAGTYNIVIGQISREDLTTGTPIPEPASLELLGVALIGLGVLQLKKRT